MSSIEWTDATWNPTVGCTPVSSGCLNCYAATMARRLEAMGAKGYEPANISTVTGKLVSYGPVRHKTLERVVRIAEVRGGRAVFTGEVRCLPERLDIPLRTRKPTVWFVNSMSDLFHEAVPFEFIDRVFAVMNATVHTLPIKPDSKPWHTYQVLTKRPERMAEYLESRAPKKWKMGTHPIFKAGRGDGGALRGLPLSQKMSGEVMNAGACLLWPLPNVWLGTSVEDQARADERIPHLLRCPAQVRFLSVEPMLGPVDLKPFFDGPINAAVDEIVGALKGSKKGSKAICVDSPIHWVIVGGESGPNARPFDIAWARSLRDQCRAAGVPFFMKQMGRVVHCRNDHVSRWLGEVGMGLDYTDTSETRMQGDPVRVMLNDPKGGDMDEWPEDLRVREMPA